MAIIINLTQHDATTEQKLLGVRDVPESLRQGLCKALTFDTIPSRWDLLEHAREVLNIAQLAEKELAAGPNPESPLDARTWAMVGGAPFFMPILEEFLCKNFYPVYAFSKRESVDQVQADGSVRKVAVFRHEGFVKTIF